MGKKATINFIKESVEFFRSDYYLLYDFLCMDTPWDRCMTYKLGISKEDLTELKELFICGVISTYQKLLQASLAQGQINFVDYQIVNKMQNGNSLNKLFFEDSESYLTMMKFYLYALRDEATIKKDTFNENKVLISNICELYNGLYEKYNLGTNNIDAMSISSTNSYEKRYKTFREELYVGVCQLFKTNFRRIEDEQQFINYLFSLAYAHLYIDRENDTELDSIELAVMSVIEAEVEPRESFYYNADIAIVTIELFTDLCDTMWPHIDIRKQVDDDTIQRYFSNLDDNYDTKFDSDIIITDYSVDTSLDEVLNSMLENMSTDEVYHLLTSSECIYDLLMDNDLDGRYEDYFKYLMVCKIISDTFEYESYLNISKGNQDRTINYQNLLTMKPTRENIIKYFEDHSHFLIEKYFEYHSRRSVVERARLHVANMKESRIVTSIFPYASINYFLLKVGKVVPMESVDYINGVIAQEKKVSLEDFVNTNLENDKLLRSICLNVYENLLLETTLTDECKAVVTFLEGSEDVVKDLKSNTSMLEKIIYLFNLYNPEETTYKEEQERRSNVKKNNKVKMLNKLNPFAQNEK